MSVPTLPAGRDGADLQAAFAATLVDEWARCGMGHAVVCPGSRSTPLALALARHPGIGVTVRLDERSAAFTALGVGLATGRPAAVLTTSGTAAVELHPAVVEADRAGVPLLACTADRPPELRDVGAPQTVDQTHLYGRAVRWFCDPGVADAAGRPAWRSLAARAVAETTAGPGGPGPVHLNLPFREPLLGEAGRAGGLPAGRPDGAPWHAVTPGLPWPDPDALEDLCRTGGLEPGTRGLVVAGAGCGDPGAVLVLARALGWPVLADPRSGVRVPDPLVVGGAEGILRSERFATGHRPDVVLRLGERWAAASVNRFVADAVGSGARSMVVDPFGRWPDPDRSTTTLVRADPGRLCRWVAERTPAADRPGVGSDGSWAGAWTRAEAAAAAVLRSALDARPDDDRPDDARPDDARPLDELGLASRLFAWLPDGATLVVSSSMPVRDLEAAAAPRPHPPRVVANRGANGIDGVVSTALGAAVAAGASRAGAPAGPVVALVGDLAFLHDASALIGTTGFLPDLTVVVADNGGGGIFSFLEPATVLDPAEFETLFGTPQAQDVARVASGCGWPVLEAGGEPGEGDGDLETCLARAVGTPGPAVVRVRLPRRPENVDAHAGLYRAVVEAVDAAG